MNRRWNAFVKYPLQRKYVLFIFIAMITPTLLVAACLYYLIWQTVANELAIPELIAEALFPALEHVNFVLLAGLPVVFVLILFFAVRLTHRLAGPIYRIEKMLGDMIETGDFTKEIHIRKNDDLHTLVQQINSALRKASEQKKIT